MKRWALGLVIALCACTDYANLGQHCGGNFGTPKKCAPGLVCDGFDDVGGTCINPDAGIPTCAAVGQVCSSDSDCCARNCVASTGRCSDYPGVDAGADL